IDVLICTTIIENGIDLPNVNTLIIENAERFGLAQLHQLRGRVGRSNRQAYAYFLYKNENMNINAEKRLETLETDSKIGDGFRIASRDMEIRGIGNILGEQQHGHIYAIGLNLYSKLLEQAVNKIINGVEEDIDFETKINLPINFNIPENIICDKNKRIYIYQKLAAINNEDDLKNEMISIFKNLDNKNIYNLYDILILKLYSKKLKIKNIEYNNNKIILDFDDVINEIIKNRLIKKYPNTVIKEKQIKIDKSELGYKWLDNLISLLKINL
ncbi:transcription-repair coupling factor, partial [Patescibacteria group bacterium]|nr:transcription-repair coupling factor [Patescibacteria group bacterium]